MRNWSRRMFFVALLGVCVTQLSAADTRQWKPLNEDSLHDPENPAIQVLQQPASALQVLPPDRAGNLVDWVKALRDGHINPRTNLETTTEVRVLDPYFYF